MNHRDSSLLEKWVRLLAAAAGLGKAAARQLYKCGVVEVMEEVLETCCGLPPNSPLLAAVEEVYGTCARNSEVMAMDVYDSTSISALSGAALHSSKKPSLALAALDRLTSLVDSCGGEAFAQLIRPGGVLGVSHHLLVMATTGGATTAAAAAAAPAPLQPMHPWAIAIGVTTGAYSRTAPPPAPDWGAPQASAIRDAARCLWLSCLDRSRRMTGETGKMSAPCTGFWAFLLPRNLLMLERRLKEDASVASSPVLPSSASSQEAAPSVGGVDEGGVSRGLPPRTPGAGPGRVMSAVGGKQQQQQQGRLVQGPSPKRRPATCIPSGGSAVGDSSSRMVKNVASAKAAPSKVSPKADKGEIVTGAEEGKRPTSSMLAAVPDFPEASQTVSQALEDSARAESGRLQSLRSVGALEGTVSWRNDTASRVIVVEEEDVVLELAAAAPRRGDTGAAEDDINSKEKAREEEESSARSPVSLRWPLSPSGGGLDSLETAPSSLSPSPSFPSAGILDGVRQARAAWLSLLDLRSIVSWSQTSTDVSLWVKLPLGTKRKELEVEVTPDRLCICLGWMAPDRPVLDGRLKRRVKSKEAIWCITIEDEDKEERGGDGGRGVAAPRRSRGSPKFSTLHLLLPKDAASAYSPSSSSPAGGGEESGSGEGTVGRGTYWRSLFEGSEERSHLELLKEAVEADEEVVPFEQMDEGAQEIFLALREKQAATVAGRHSLENSFDDFRCVIGDGTL